MTDGCDLGVRLEEWRLFNGPIRSSYSTLPQHDVDTLFLISHLLSKQNNKQQAPFLLFSALNNQCRICFHLHRQAQK